MKITKPNEGTLIGSFALNGTALEDAFTGNLLSPECGESLINYLRSVEQRINEIIALVKTTQESQIKGELDMSKLQESIDFIRATFDEYERDKKQKEKKKLKF